LPGPRPASGHPTSRHGRLTSLKWFASQTRHYAAAIRRPLEHLTLGQALAEHLAASGLPPDGGDSERFAVVKIALFPYPIPNTKARKRAVKIHDLNHLVSGYLTDRIGELEISAWELASGGCQRYPAAWVLDLGGLMGGLVVAPRRTVRAFRAGRSQQNLYRYPLDELLAMPLDSARRLVDQPPPDRRRWLPPPVQLIALTLVALPATAVMALLWFVLMPAWGISKLTGRRQAPPPQASYGPV